MYIKGNFTASHTISDQKTSCKNLIKPQTSKASTPTPLQPSSKATPPPHKTTPNQNTPKASQTADLNCLNFKLAVPPHK